EWQALLRDPVDLLRRVAVQQIPLVHGTDRGAARLVHFTGDALVLIGDALDGVHHEDAHVGPGDGVVRAPRAVELDPRLHMALPAQPRGIDQDDGPAVVAQRGID